MIKAFVLKHLWWIVSLLLVTFAMILVAFVPTLPMLVSEMRLSNDVEQLGKSGDLRGITDGSLRTSIQVLARKRGLHIEFEEMFVQYLERREGENVLQPARLGYALPLELRLFGVLPWRVVAVRLFVVRGGNDS